MPIRRLAALAAIFAAGLVLAFVSQAAPPCWSNSPHKVCPTTSTTSTTPPTTTAPTTTTATTTTATPTTTTAPTTTAPTTTSAPAPAAPPLFDGRAFHMSVLYSTSTTNQGQSPVVWDCLCFLNNDISLVTDSRYGKVYSIRAGVGSTNPWFQLSAGKASAETSTKRAMVMGEWDWYANAYRIDAGLTGPSWVVLSQFGYPSLSSPPLAVDVKTVNGVAYYAVERNAGKLTQNSNGFWVGTNVETPTLLQVPYGKWVELIVGVKWATDNTGEIRIYARVQGETDFHLVLSRSATPTFQYKTDVPTGALDKEGLYYGYDDARSSFPTEQVYESGLTRSASYDSARATFP